MTQQNFMQYMQMMEERQRVTLEQQNKFFQELLHQNRVERPENQGVTLLDFQNTKPISFAYAPEPMDAEDWLMDTERKLKTVGCTDEEKVRYATHLLCGPAASWWDNIVAVHPVGRVFTWEEFKRKFRESNVPKSVMELKRREFENLEQKDKAIMTYDREFSGLSRYAADEVSTEDKRKKRFMRGLNPSFKMQLRMLKAMEFQELVDAAITMEDDFKQVQEDKRKKAKFEPKKFVSNKPNTNLTFKPRYNPSGNRRTPGAQFMANIICRSCGSKGHYSKDCRRPKVICFGCRQEGHMLKDCPNKNNGGGKSGGGGGSRNGNSGGNWKNKKPFGKLNCTSLEEVINSDKAVIGIDKSNPCQLAPSVGTRGDKELISMARSTSSTSSVASNAMDRGKQIETDLVDFVPHPPSRVDAYAYLEEPMEMTFGRFHFRVGKEGSNRLEVPVSSGSSAADYDFSESSSSLKIDAEKVSSPRFTKSTTSEELVKIFGSMPFESSADSNISSDSDSVDSFNFIDRSTSIREVFADLYDGVTDPEEENKATIYHQVCAIGEPSRQEDETSEAFDDLGCERLSFLDAYSGYNQIRLKKEDEVKTAFITPYGVFCYRTMPFGLKNAGATYQRMMQKCLATQIGKNVQVYIDDVVITTKKGSTLIDDLRETFDNLDKFCLKLNPTKCSFGVPAGELLGFLVSARGIEANPEKIQAIVKMRKPTKLKEIQ
ncbi:hypothetical protein QYE76_007127 [Lolium multiflorum]|uniref:CCHC-type domain-containing protein n=1 Tax=Lolium multiflorum TaxID=4521 RepID=A0AAD8RXM6_LOLMU|nr:hypothetical protein QYE76_007127 [Lolium multiflorum]